MDTVGAAMAEEDTAGDLVAIQEDLAEVDFMVEVLEDTPPDSLLDAALVAAALVDSLVYIAEASAAVAALVVELAAVVHFLEEAHNHLRTILQVDRFVVDQFKEDPLAIRLPV